MNQIIVQLKQFIRVLFCLYRHNNVRDMLYTICIVWIQYLYNRIFDKQFLYIIFNFKLNQYVPEKYVIF